MDPSFHPLGSYVELVDGQRGVVRARTACFVKVELKDGSIKKRKPENLKAFSIHEGQVQSETAHAEIHEISDGENEAAAINWRGRSNNEKGDAVQISDSEDASDETKPAKLGHRMKTRSQTNPSGAGFPFRFGDYEIGHITLLHPDQEDKLVTQTLAGKIFGRRLLRYDFKSKSPSDLKDAKVPTSLFSEGYRFELLGKKVHSEKTKFGRLLRPECYYVVSEGPDMDPINIEVEMNKIANFSSMEDPGKMASRVELLFSPSKTNGILKLDSDDFQFVPDNTETARCSEGNSHAPPSFFAELVRRKICKRTDTTVQVRFILGGKLGKGTLTLKHGINCIQLPSSMVKVGASEVSSSSGINLISVTKCFPSKKSGYMNQYLEEKPLSATALDELQNPISDIFIDVLKDKGVPKSDIQAYNSRKVEGKAERKNQKKSRPRRSNRLKYAGKQNKTKALPVPQDKLHFADAYVVGISDPTPGAVIPFGAVTIPGLPEYVTSVLVSRSPAMDKTDMLRLPVFHTHLLDHHHFGEICFGNGAVPLPNLIADGDLDGDLYLVIWDEKIVESVPMTDVALLEKNTCLSKKREKSIEDKSGMREINGRSWFRSMQDSACDVGLEIRISQLISILYEEAKYELERGDPCVYEDYVAYGNAYKASLDIKKHGDAVALPESLWPEKMDEALKCFLRKPSTYP